MLPPPPVVHASEPSPAGRFVPVVRLVDQQLMQVITTSSRTINQRSVGMDVRASKSRAQAKLAESGFAITYIARICSERYCTSRAIARYLHIAHVGDRHCV